MQHRYDKTLSNYFKYDPESPSFLRWISTTTRSVRVGDVAGTISGDYWNVKLFGKSLKAHKIVWALHNNFANQDGMEIDHEDGNTFNNRFDNLRLITRTVNMRNSALRENNSSGTCGVRHRIDVDGKSRYIAHWRDLSNKQCSKSFSVESFGTNAEKLAIEYRSDRIKELNILGAGYTERHGI